MTTIASSSDPPTSSSGAAGAPHGGSNDKEDDVSNFSASMTSHTKLRICILQSSYEHTNSAFAAVDATPVRPEHWLRTMGHEYENILVSKATAANAIIEAARKGFDL